MIHHFYHIYADGKWHEPVSEHIRALEMGLKEQLKTFSVGIVGSSENRAAVKTWLSQRIEYTICAEAESGWEAVTQQPMHDFAQTNDGLILYCHSKGSSDPSDVNIRWRRSMIWHNVIQWKFAVEKLKDHETYGCHFIQPLISGMPEHRQGNWMYAGTFYWVKAELLRTWMRVPLTHRHESEGWIGYKYAESPWPVWDCTPYFPNTNTFMDGWVENPNFTPEQKGVSLPPQKTINV